MNTQKKIAGLLRETSQVFASDNAIGVDLNTMAFAIDNMTSDKFSSVVSEEKLAAWLGDEKADEAKEEVKEETKEAGDEPEENNTQQKDSEMSKSAGSLWSKQASQAVKEGLVLDVLGTKLAKEEEVEGAKLTKDQIPDGKDNPGVQNDGAAPVSEAALKDEQTPKDEKNHDSGMVAESNKVKTEETKLASEDDSKEEDSKEAAEDDFKEEETEEEPKEAAEEPKEETEEAAKYASDSVLLDAGNTVEAAELTASDEEALSKIFQ